MGVLFTNLAMLAGLTALGLPVLIHLLLKRKKQRLRFSTLRFFQQHDEHSSQRRKLRNLLLLAVRLLLLAVLVLAFARPYLPNPNPSGTNQKRRLAVLVVDRSASMQAADLGGPRWTRAKDAAQKILADLRSNDRAALISCASHGEVLSGPAPSEAIIRLLKELPSTGGTGNLAEGMRLAGRIVCSAGADANATIYVISDLQSSACKDLAAWPVPASAEVKTIQIGDLMTPNVAVTEFQLENREANRPHLVVANYSDEPAKGLKMKLLLDGRETLSQQLDFTTGNVARVDLALPPLTPGWHSGVARLEGDDALALDNVRYDAFFTPQPLRTVVVETRHGVRVFEEESFFLTSALDPMQDATNSAPSRFAIEKTTPDEVLKKLSSSPEGGTCDLLILPGLRQVPSGLGTALSKFVRSGGGVVLFLNDGVDPSRYNTEFRDLLPVQLGHQEGTAGLKWHLEDYDLKAPMFAPFRRPGSGNLALPEFNRRFTIATNISSTVAASFEDDVPAIVSMAVGRGRVVLVNTTAETAWTDWPKHKTFVPWLHSLCLSLASRSGLDQTRLAIHLVVADEKDISLGAGAGNQPFRLQRPGEKESVVIAGADGRLQNLDFSKPGIYSITDQGGREIQRLAVNPPVEESDLAALTPADFQRQLARTAEPGSPVAAGLLGSNDHQKELARLLLLASLALLFAETFLANRTYA